MRSLSVLDANATGTYTKADLILAFAAGADYAKFIDSKRNTALVKKDAEIEETYAALKTELGNDKLSTMSVNAVASMISKRVDVSPRKANEVVKRLRTAELCRIRFRSAAVEIAKDVSLSFDDVASRLAETVNVSIDEAREIVAAEFPTFANRTVCKPTT
ncbi:MAG: hypothetical protein R3C28_13090 [Pirellulaceae bacterium]